MNVLFFFVDIDECVDGIFLCDLKIINCSNFSLFYECKCKEGNFLIIGDIYKCKGKVIFIGKLSFYRKFMRVIKNKYLFWFCRGKWKGSFVFWFFG